MRLTRHTDYAMRVLFYLAVNREGRATVGAIAARYAISRNHLVKVVHALTRAGYVAGQRGRGGGIRLARAPADINIGALVRWSEPDRRLIDCVGCEIAPSCGLPGPLSKALAAFVAVLDGYTLQDILDSSDGIDALLGAA